MCGGGFALCFARCGGGLLGSRFLVAVSLATTARKQLHKKDEQ